MAKKSIKITESQYKEILENIDEFVDTSSNQNSGLSFQTKLSNTTKNINVNKASKAAGDLSQAMGQPRQDGSAVIQGEGKIITKKELKENRLKKIKKNSTYFKIKDIK